jgi:hypothetical protein
MTRYALSFLAVIWICSSTQAQSLQEMMNKAMEEQAKNGGGQQMTFEENTDPFTPLNFTGSYRMEVMTYEADGPTKESPMNVNMAFTPDKMALLPEMKGSKEQVRMVMDLRNKLTYTLITDGQGQRTGIKMKMMKATAKGADVQEAEEAKVVRTSETRTINGYTCTKYTYASSEGKGEAWVAEEVKFDMMSAMAQMAGAKKTEGWQNVKHEGLVMENTWNDANGTDKVVMIVHDLVVGKVDEALFSTAGYEMQDMTAIPMNGQ